MADTTDTEIEQTLPDTPAGWIRHDLHFADKRFKAALDVKDTHFGCHLNITIAMFNSLYLMETLRRVNPEAAAHAAQVMHDLAETGDTYGELIHEWGEAVRSGHPINNWHAFPYPAKGPA